MWSWQRWSGSAGTTTPGFTARSATSHRPSLRPSGAPGWVSLCSPDASRDDCTQPEGTHNRPSEQDACPNIGEVIGHHGGASAVLLPGGAEPNPESEGHPASWV